MNVRHTTSIPWSRVGFLILSCLLVSFWTGPLEKQELLQNTGFESELAPWFTANMSRTMTFEIDNKVKKSGEASGRVERGEGQRIDFLKQFVELPADTGQVTFRALARIEKAGSVRATLYFVDAQDQKITDPEIGRTGRTRKKWKELSGTFDVPEGAVQVGVNFWFNEPGVVWLDDVSLQWEGPAGKPGKKAGKGLQLSNGEFAKNLDGWRPLDLGPSSVKASHDRGVNKGSLRLEREGRRRLPLGGLEARAPRTGREGQAKLSFRARIDKGAVGVVSLQALGTGGALLASERVELEPAGKRFKTHKLQLDLPRGTAEVAVVAAIGGEGQVWFDDMELAAR